MSDENQVAIAKAIATIAHTGQTDKAGNPYIGHPERVAAILTQERCSDDVIAAGWLHDVLEDTTLTRDDLSAAGLNRHVIGYVEAVTRRPDERVEDYYERVGNGSTGALKLKAADIRDNSDINRLALLDDATIVRLTRKYAKARLLLGLVKE